MITGVHLPDKAQGTDAANVHGCESACLNNCSCTAYHFNGTCLALVQRYDKLRHDIDGLMDNIFIRLAASELPDSRREKHWSIIGIIIVGPSVVLPPSHNMYFEFLLVTFDHSSYLIFL